MLTAIEIFSGHMETGVKVRYIVNRTVNPINDLSKTKKAKQPKTHCLHLVPSVHVQFYKTWAHWLSLIAAPVMHRLTKTNVL